MHVCNLEPARQTVAGIDTFVRWISGCPEILCLQEVGGESRLQVGQTVTRDLIIGDVEYVVYLHNTTKAYHAVAVAVQTRLSPAKPCFTALSVGLAVELFLGPARFFLASLHFPYEQRSDAVDVWMDAIETLTLSLAAFPSQRSVFLGCDLNQTLHTEVDHFAPVVQLRLLLARFLLQTSEYVGDASFNIGGKGLLVDLSGGGCGSWRWGCKRRRSIECARNTFNVACTQLPIQVLVVARLGRVGRRLQQLHL